MLLLFGTLCAIASAGCFTSDELAAHGIFPADRSQVRALTPIFSDWRSSRLVSGVVRIILEEAMGYSMNPYVKAGPYGWAKDLEGVGGDYMVETWTAGPSVLLKELSIFDDKLLTYGSVGYSATSSYYVPTYSREKWMTERGIDLMYFGNWNHPDVIANFSALNIADFILNHPTLDISTEPNSVFSPPICDEPIFEGSNDTKPCATFIAFGEDWDPNFFQALVRNLNLPIKLSFWAPPFGNAVALIEALYAAEEDFVFYGWIPAPLMIKNPGYPIMFPKNNDACMSNINTTNLQGMYSSVNCDFPRIELVKYARSDWFKSHPATEEAAKLMGQFDFKSTDMEAMLNATIYNDPVWTDDNLGFDEMACTWLKDNVEVWSIWVSNDYQWAKKLNIEQVLLFITAGVIACLGIAYILWKAGVLDTVENVLFDMFLIYIGKIWLDLFDLVSDTMSYFTSINGQIGIPVWFNVCYIIIVGASFVASANAFRQNVINAWIAFWTRHNVQQDNVDAEELKKIRVRSSIWQGATHRPSISDLNADKELESIWTHEELEFAKQKIHDCYEAAALALVEDLPMTFLNVYMLFTLPQYVNTFVYISLFLSLFFLGKRFSEFFEIKMYRKQHEYAQKWLEIHENQTNLRENMKVIENLHEKYAVPADVMKQGFEDARKKEEEV